MKKLLFIFILLISLLSITSCIEPIRTLDEIKSDLIDDYFEMIEPTREKYPPWHERAGEFVHEINFTPDILKYIGEYQGGYLFIVYDDTILYPDEHPEFRNVEVNGIKLTIRNISYFIYYIDGNIVHSDLRLLANNYSFSEKNILDIKEKFENYKDNRYYIEDYPLE